MSTDRRLMRISVRHCDSDEIDGLAGGSDSDSDIAHDQIDHARAETQGGAPKCHAATGRVGDVSGYRPSSAAARRLTSNRCPGGRPGHRHWSRLRSEVGDVHVLVGGRDAGSAAEVGPGGVHDTV